MNILPFLALGLLATLILVILRPLRGELAMLLSLAAGALIAVLVIGRLGEVLRAVSEMAARAEMHPLFLRTVLKVMGLAYLAGFTAQVCRDAGEGAMAGKIELLGKVAILYLALPVMWAVLDTMLRLL